MTKPKVYMQGVAKTYASRGTLIHALQDIHLEVRTGEIVALVGPSGSGKTTILNILAGFIGSDEGVVMVDGEPVVGPGEGRVMVFQEDATFPWKTVDANIRFPLRTSGAKSSQYQEDEIEKYLRLAGLDKRRSSYPKELSGGMRKKLELVRAFISRPSLILADEPFNGIDTIAKDDLQDLLIELWMTTNNTIIVATHDIEDALYLADRVFVLSNRPASIQATVPVAFPRPRNASLRTSAEFQQLRAEVRNLIGVGGRDAKA